VDRYLSMALLWCFLVLMGCGDSMWWQHEVCVCCNVVILKHVAGDGMLPSCCSAANGSLCISLCGRSCMYVWAGFRNVLCQSFWHLCTISSSCKAGLVLLTIAEKRKCERRRFLLHFQAPAAWWFFRLW
jgi:hypothetical protein